MSKALQHRERSSPATTVLVSGYGLRIAIERGHLIADGGIADERTRQRFSRLSAPRRLIILGQSGGVTLEALRWLRDVGATFVHIDADGQLVTVGTSQTTNDVRLRRAQALATFHPYGLHAARYLLLAKVTGQHRALSKVPRANTARDFLSSVLVEMQRVSSLADLRHLESRAAATYWDTLRDFPVQFVRKDSVLVPAHWGNVGPRQSPLSASPRKAVTPAQALLNYAYAVLEAEARIACLAVGCDPGMGIIHTDHARRDSFALDLMEAVRPAVDAYVLHLLATRTFLKADFFETREGSCRVMPVFTEALAQTGPEWAKLLAPVAEHSADILRRGADQISTGGLSIVARGKERTRVSAEVARLFRTPLTGRNRSRTRGEKQNGDAPLSATLALPLPRRCKECGVEVTARRRLLCDSCLATMPARASQKAQAVLRQLRAVGEYSRSADAVCEQRRVAASRQMQAIAAWEANNPNPPGPEVFRKDILPKLTACSITSIVEATGLSRVMCSNIRRGVKNPHPRHWDALRTLAGGKSM